MEATGAESPVVGTWALSFTFSGDETRTGEWHIEGDGTFEGHSSGDWVISGDAVTLTFDNGTIYIGTIVNGNFMSGTMVSGIDGSTGTWEATKTSNTP